MRPASYIALLLMLAGLACGGGCDWLNGEEEPTANTPAKRERPAKRRPVDSKEPAETVEEPAALAMEFDFDPAAQAREGFAQWIKLPPNGPVVLKITSYETPAQESFPSFLLSARVAGETPEALVGQSVPAVMFAQLQSGGPVYENAGANGIQLEISAQQNGKLRGEIRGKLRTVGSPETIDVTGQFEAEWIDGT